MRTNRQKGDNDTGRPLPEDRWPRIIHAPYLMDGHAHIRGTEVTVHRVLRELAYDRLPIPAALIGKGLQNEDTRAVLLYSADLIQTLPRLLAELQKLHGVPHG